MIRSIYLLDFRNFKKKKMLFDEGINTVVGQNASGKTNILESIYLLSTGKSFKAGLEEEMIRYDGEIARVQGLLDSDTKLEVLLTRGEISIDMERSEKVSRKRMFVNGVGKRLIDFAGQFKTVLFAPSDLDLVTESPSIRRKYLDAVLSQVDREYRRATLSYEKGLRQRNRLLLRIREEGISRSQLLFWDRLLIKNGDYIQNKRHEYFDFVNNTNPLRDQRFQIVYDKSAISESRLAQYAGEEVAAATTLVGPHRDDFVFEIENGTGKRRNLSKYGSRGEQRMGVLWLKLAELAFIERISQEKPTLLLDDIFSELDHEHRDVVVDIAKNQQTIITTADTHYINDISSTNRIGL